MPSSYLNYPFDPELFLMQWQNEPDPTLTAMINSGAVQRNGTIQSLIANGSDVYTIPFYNTLTGDEDNYDGDTDITMSTPAGGSQSGVVYGRAHSWRDTDFVHDFNSGADPMRQITSQVAKFWTLKRQSTLLGILSGVFGVADDSTDKWDQWANHVLNIASTGSTAGEANKLGATSIGDAIQKACGDNSGVFSMAWMHSRVASNLAGIQLLNYRKYTDPMGIERQLSIADCNGLTVIIDDGVPVQASASATGENEYTTYLFGNGAVHYATAPVKVPVEVGREQLTDGGYNYYITRLRETLHPNGFSFVVPTAGYNHSPTKAQLSNAANWRLVGVPKAMAMAKIVSNG